MFFPFFVYTDANVWNFRFALPLFKGYFKEKKLCSGTGLTLITIEGIQMSLTIEN